MLLYLQQLRVQVAEAEQHSTYVSDSDDDEVHEERWEAMYSPMVIPGPFSKACSTVVEVILRSSHPSSSFMVSQLDAGGFTRSLSRSWSGQ